MRLDFFFFEDERMDKLIPYVFLAHIFGATSSPMVTAFTLKFHAEKVREEFGEKVYYNLTKKQKAERDKALPSWSEGILFGIAMDEW